VDFAIVSTASTQLSWSHNLEILSGSKTFEERLFYTKLILKDRKLMDKALLIQKVRELFSDIK
jgi:hypothetical protein